MVFRTDFETTILRQRGTLFQEYGEDSYSNIYTIEVVNKTRKTHEVRVELLEPEGSIIPMGDPIVAEKGNVGKGSFLVVIKKKDLKSATTLLKFALYSQDQLIEEYEATFVGPNALDNN
jgi:uncharacterized protein YciI